MSQSADDSQGAGACPPGITWYNRMQQIFAPYVECMLNQGINLGKYNGTDGDSVVENISDIKTAIDNGSMPRGAQYQATWKAANGKFWFDCWYQQGYPEGTPGNLGGGADASDASDAGGAAAGGSITWTNTMKQVFSPYVDCMLNQGIDLSKYNGTDGDSVVENITDIQQAIDNGSMPRGAQYQQQWAKDNGKALFDQWYAAGYPE
jgi:hypothetical protein